MTENENKQTAPQRDRWGAGRSLPAVEQVDGQIPLDEVLTTDAGPDVAETEVQSR